MIRLNLFMIWFLHFLSLLSVVCRYYRQNSSSRIIVVLVYTVSTLFLYIPVNNRLNCPPNGSLGDTHKQNRHMIHAGQLIERTLHEQGRTVTWFATQLCCTRPNVYKIFEKRISTSTCSGASPASSAMIFSAIFPTASIPETSPVYPNRIQFRIVLGTMLSPGSILLSHTFAGILTYNHKRT